MSLSCAVATEHIVWSLQLLQVEVMLAAVVMHAVSERPQAIARVFWELTHLWAGLDVGCCLRMMDWWI